MKILIEGMSCGNCVKHVKEALEEVPGITGVEVKLEEKAAYVQGEASEAELVEAIEQAGYDMIRIEK